MRSTAKIGKSFENEIAQALEARGYTVMRLPDGCRQVNQFKIIRMKNQFDFIAHKKDDLMFFDAKTTEEKRFPHSKINRDQLEHLCALECNGYRAGYIINFSLLALTVFAPASLLVSIVKGSSISPENCLSI